MKSFEEVRRKLLEYPPGATVPLSHEEINVLKANSRWEQHSTSTSGYVFGRYFGLEAAPGSKLTLDAVVAAAREIRGLRVGDHFSVRCMPEFSHKMIVPTGEVDIMRSTYERFELTPSLAAQVWPGWEPENPYRTHWPV